MLPGDVRMRSFKRVRVEAGYRLIDVDDYRDRAESRLTSLAARIKALTEHNLALTSHEDFTISRTLSKAVLGPAHEELPGPPFVEMDGKAGYDRTQVDEFGHELNIELRRLEGLLNEQRDRLEVLLDGRPRPDYTRFLDDLSNLPTERAPTRAAAVLGAVMLLLVLLLVVLLLKYR